jgi:hypothetical protein
MTIEQSRIMDRAVDNQAEVAVEEIIATMAKGGKRIAWFEIIRNRMLRLVIITNSLSRTAQPGPRTARNKTKR